MPSDMHTPPERSSGERSLLRHVIASAEEGNPDSVMEAMDVFWDTYFNGEGTAEWKLRSTALDQAVGSKSMTSAMEIGAYCGYTAVRIGRLMPEGGKLVYVELDPLCGAIATKVRKPHVQWPGHSAVYHPQFRSTVPALSVRRPAFAMRQSAPTHRRSSSMPGSRIR